MDQVKFLVKKNADLNGPQEDKVPKECTHGLPGDFGLNFPRGGLVYTSYVHNFADSSRVGNNIQD